jgi:hypothetical protein
MLPLASPAMLTLVSILTLGSLANPKIYAVLNTLINNFLEFIIDTITASG